MTTKKPKVKMRRPKKILIGLALGLALTGVVTALWVAINNLLQERKIRPISGQLTTSLAPQTLQVGQFVVTWDGQQLRVSHSSNPQKSLWNTRSGQMFVATGIGQETVKESRANYTIDDDRRLLCAQQTLDAIRLDPSKGSVHITGALNCDDNQRVSYELIFTASSENQLSFKLQFGSTKFNRAYLTYASDADEHFFGFGAQYTYVDMKGKRLPIFVMEQGIGRGLQPLTTAVNALYGAGGDWSTTYAGVPEYISSRMRALFLDTYAYSFFDMRQADQVQIGVFANTLSGSILNGDTPARLIQEYTRLIGRMRPLPTWVSNGLILGVQGGTQRVRDLYSKVKQAGVPIAAVWIQDWEGQRTTSFGKQLWWNWQLDADRYPDWTQLVTDLQKDGIRVMVYINPFLVDVHDKANARNNLFNDAAAKGYLVKTSDGKPYLILQTDFSAGLIDLTNPDAWNWYKQQLKTELLNTGVSGWMADFGEGLPYDSILSGGTGALLHNQYPELWAKFNRELIQEMGQGQIPAQDLLFFMRSGFRNSPTDATLFWLGDQLVTWDEYDGIKTAVTGLLSSGFSGFSLNHSDIGGYTSVNNPVINIHRDQELLLRWIELNAFTAVFRSHEGNRPDENLQVYSNDVTLAQLARMGKIYQAWSAYRAQLIQEAATSGLPIVRHPFINYPGDTNLYNIRYEQFMLGTEFMVVPVLDPKKTTVDVYLPAGKWIHVWTGVTYGNTDQGTRITIDAPIGSPAVFYREGSTAGIAFVNELRKVGLLK